MRVNIKTGSTLDRASDERSTPAWLFAKLNEVFEFELDAAASRENAKCEHYLSKNDDALSLSWRRPAGFSREFTRIFLNPPYSRGQLAKWLEKCAMQAYDGCQIAAVLPVDTGTGWFDRVWTYSSVLFFLKGRVKFNGLKTAAFFPTMIAVIGDYRLPSERHRIKRQLESSLPGHALVL